MRFIKSLDVKEYFYYYGYIKLRALTEYFIFTLPKIRQIRKTKVLKNSKKGKRAFVFANGTSLLKLDADKVLQFQKNGYDVFAGNSFINSEFAEKVKPNYYIFSDPMHFGKYFKNDKRDDILRAERDVEKVLNEKTTMFIPHRYFSKNNFNDYYVFNDSFDPFSRNVINPQKKRGHFTLTLYKMLGMACYMGYEHIYICGFDNDYFTKLIVDQHNNIFLGDNHFYSEEIQEEPIIPFNWVENMEAGLLYFAEMYRGIYRFKGYPITNLDKDSLIDCFSKQHDLDVYK